MSSDAASLFNKLSDEKNFPHLDAQVLRIQEILSREDFKLSELAEAIKYDPLIATNVLSVANKLKITGVNQIDSIKHAIVYIGKETLREIVLIAGIRNLDVKTETFIMEDFWEESINAGMIAEGLTAKFAPHLIPDEVYIGACLANIGKLLMAMLYPKVADEVIETMYGEEEPMNWQDVEERINVPRHTTLGEIAAVLWGLPTYVADIASHHHNIDKLFKNSERKQLTKIDIVAVAIQIGHLMQVEPKVSQEKLIAKFCQSQKISRKVLDSFIVSIKSRINNKKLAS
jgi:HD-like signal output (HDOD) protein